MTNDFASSEPDLTLAALRAAYEAGRSPEDVVRAVYARIRAVKDNPVWIHLVPEEEALARAQELMRGPRDRPLWGVPFAVKDNIDVAGIPTTAACPAYAYTPERHATAVAKLLAAGAILVGKTNLDQFATGLVGVRSPYGACRNPRNPDYISGGSSSGSAVAVAMGLASFSLGTDTAGSGRVPAAFNGLVGLKPTRGLVSTAGVVPACRSLDCVSVFAGSVADAQAVLAVMQGVDESDPYSRPVGEGAPLVGERFRFAVPLPAQREFFGDLACRGLYEKAIERMAAIGGVAVEFDLAPFLAAQALLYDGPWIAERTAQLGAFIDAHPADVLPVTKGIVDSGRRFSAAETFAAQHRLAALRREADALWQRADVMLVPGAPTIYKLEELEREPVLLNSRLGIYTNFVNLLDLAGLTVPAGARPDGLPFGVTLVGPTWSDARLAALGARFLGEAAAQAPAPGTVRIAVVGAHLSGMPLNVQLLERGAQLVRRARTAPCYRLYALDDQRPPKPGLVRSGDGHGACIEVETWDLPASGFGTFVADIPPPLGIGTLELEDGERVKGFLCEPHALAGRTEITALGGWRRYVQSTS